MNPSSTGPTLSVITVTFNCQGLLPRLRASLLAQTDPEFEWVVVDGLSSDATVEEARQFPADRLRLLSEPDFGIYHALNKAVELATGDFYVVVGADDTLDPGAIASYRQSIRESGADFVSARVRMGSRELLPNRGSRWLRGGNALVSSHAVGTAIRRSLHQRVGLYSRRFVNAADMHFVLKAVDEAGATVHAAHFLAGHFAPAGVSSVDRVCSLSEAYRIQLLSGHNRWVQLVLFGLRLIRSQLARQR